MLIVKQLKAVKKYSISSVKNPVFCVKISKIPISIYLAPSMARKKLYALHTQVSWSMSLWLCLSSLVEQQLLGDINHITHCTAWDLNACRECLHCSIYNPASAFITGPKTISPCVTSLCDRQWLNWHSFKYTSLEISNWMKSGLCSA